MKKAIVITIGLIILCIAIGGTKEILKSDSDRAKEYNSQIETIDGFYGTGLTEGMDVRDLPRDYTADDWEKDGAVIADSSLKDNKRYKSFMEDCQSGHSAYIRIIRLTVDGDPVICDIMYSEKADRYYAVTDNTRDRLSTDKEIVFKGYRSLSEYRYGNRGYLVLYNGKTDKDDVLVVTGL